MNTIKFSIARNNLVKIMEQVCDTHDPVVVTRENARSIVMISLEDYNSIEETVYLLRSPSNAANLRESIKQYKQDL